MMPLDPAMPPEYDTRPRSSSWSTRASNLGWLVPLFGKAVPSGPSPSAGYAAPPTVAVGMRGSGMVGTTPLGRPQASDTKSPADSRYDQRSLATRDMLALLPNSPPGPRPVLDPALRPKMPPDIEAV